MAEKITDVAKSLPDLDLRLGIAIKRLRKDQKMTQSKLADKAQVTQACISLTENEHRNHGNTRVNLKMLQRIAYALGQGKLSDLIRFVENVPEPSGVVAEAEKLIAKTKPKA